VRAADGGGEQGELVYAPYGQLLDAQPAGTDVTLSNYAGMEPDRSDLYYARYRYYHPHTGRFLSEDPIGLAGGMNSLRRGKGASRETG
jgi:RHS repeat-associated protein